MKLAPKSVASSCTAWQVLAARWLSLWPIWCRSSICRSTTPMTLSSAKSPTSHQTSTSWGSSLTLRGHWVWIAPVTTAPQTISCSSLHLLITTCSSSTLWSPHEMPCQGSPEDRRPSHGQVVSAATHLNVYSFPSRSWEVFWANG